MPHPFAKQRFGRADEQRIANKSAQLDFTTVIVPSCDDYTFRLVQLRFDTSTASLLVQFSTNGGATFDGGSNYQWARFLMQSGATSASGSGGDTSVNIAFSLSNSASNAVSGRLDLHGTGQSTNNAGFEGHTSYYASDGSWNSYLFTATYKVLANVNAVRFKPSSGLILDGAVRAYRMLKQ